MTIAAPVPPTALEDVLELRDLLAREWPRMAPRVGLICEGGGEGEGGGNGNGEGEGAAGAAGNGEGEGAAGGQGDGDDKVTLTKSEHADLTGAIAEANKTARALKRELDAERAKGQTEEQRNADAAARLDKVTAAVSKAALTREVTAIAERLKFRSPSLAAKVIDLDGLEVDVDVEGDEPKVEVSQATKTVIERRLTEAAATHTELVGTGRASQFPGAGGSGGGNGEGDGNRQMNEAIRRAAGRA